MKQTHAQHFDELVRLWGEFFRATGRLLDGIGRSILAVFGWSIAPPYDAPEPAPPAAPEPPPRRHSTAECWEHIFPGRMGAERVICTAYDDTAESVFERGMAVVGFGPMTDEVARALLDAKMPVDHAWLSAQILMEAQELTLKMIEGQLGFLRRRQREADDDLRAT